MPSAVLFQLQSFLILGLMIFGATRARGHREQHIKIMSAAMIWDLLLILQIELTRSAVARAIKVTENPTMLKIHLFFAIGSVLLYLVMTYSGLQVLKKSPRWAQRHRRLGLTTLAFRTLTLVTSFFAA